MLSLREAFDLTPGLELKLGDRSYSVPPLTFGRFQDVLSCNFGDLKDALLAFDPAMLEGTPEEIGRRLAYFPVEAFADLAEAAVPGVTAAEWKKHASPFNVFELFLYFGQTHDWAFIAEAISFGKPREPDEDDGPTMVELSAILLDISKELGCTLQDVLGLRVEGFYISSKSITERYRAAKEAEQKQKTEDMWASLEQVLPVVKAN